MHVLTKVFIVLVSLLAVLLVPLVVVYAHNENSYKARYEAAEAKAASASMALAAAEASKGAVQASLESKNQDLSNKLAQISQDKNAAEVAVRQLESQVATSTASQADIIAQLHMIASTVSAGQQLTESLVGELRTLRADAVAIERQKVELDEALRDVTSQLEVAEQARRALSEELARVKDEKNAAVAKLGQAIAEGFGTRSTARAGALGSIPDVSLTANVLRVERSTSETLVEIDAGSRDGVKKDWSMTISSGSQFIANLKIISVDINRSTGKISMEDKARGLVQIGMIASSTAGQN